MKIAIISSGLLPLPPVDGGGVETLIDTFIKHNEITAEHQIEVYSAYSNSAKEQAKNYRYCKFIYIPMDGVVNKLKRSIRFFTNYLFKIYVGNLFIHKVKNYFPSEINYDVVLVENKPEYGLILNKYECFKGKLILHLHNDFLNKETKFSEEILDTYSRVFAISDYIKNRVAEIKNNNKIVTIHNGIDTLRFLPANNSRTLLRKRYGLKDNDVVLLYTGRLVSEKGIKELLEAFNQVPLNLPVKLVIAGSTFYNSSSMNSFSKSLLELAKQNSERIIFTGFIDYDKIPQIYSMADIGMIPSTWEEPFGLTVVEHMACGLPVIVSDSGGILEVIDKKCAVVVKRGNNFVKDLLRAILLLVKSEGIRKQMGICARQRALHFDSINYCDALNENLEKFSLRK